jgi:hypothetical protein
MLPNAYKNSQGAPADAGAQDEPLKGKKCLEEDDGTGTVSTIAPTGTATLGAWSMSDSDGLSSMSTGTDTFQKGFMAFRPEHSIIKEGKEEAGGETPAGGVISLPSVGSAMHGNGECRPCAWFYKPQGCSNGAECRHCHVCGDGEIKSRKKVKVAGLRTGSKEDREISKTSEEAVTTTEEKTAKSLFAPPGLGTPGKTTAESENAVVSSDGTLPSVGSAMHGSGSCRPCAWFYKAQGCSNGSECRHCHLCPDGELKSRKKDKVATLRQESKNEGDADDDMDAANHWGSMASYDMSPMSPMGMSPFMPPFMPPPVFFPGSSLGSAMHGTGLCRPCAWFWKAQGCENGANCFHCHLCPEGEITQRKKQKLAVMRIIDRTTGKPQQHAERSGADSPSRRKNRAKDSKLSKTSESAGYSDSDDDDEPPSSNLHDGGMPDCDSQKLPEKITLTEKAAEAPAADAMPMMVALPKDMELASAGSALHGVGKCKPCAWFHKPQGCANGAACAHCHVCDAGELQNRRKAKVNAIKSGAVTSAGEAGKNGPRVVKLASAVS